MAFPPLAFALSAPPVEDQVPGAVGADSPDQSVSLEGAIGGVTKVEVSDSDGEDDDAVISSTQRRVKGSGAGVP